jgi:hypothetical protein
MFYYKLLGVTTYAMSTIAMAALGAVLLLESKGISVSPWFTMVSVATVVWSYTAGISPACYVVMSEIFNFQVS